VWLTTQTLMGNFEGITEGQRRRAYRRYVEELKGAPWEVFAQRRGDDGRDLALLLARHSGGYTLSELGTLVGVSYAAVAQALTRAEHRIAHSAATRQLHKALCATFKLKT
jgi:hypothetical protein